MSKQTRQPLDDEPELCVAMRLERMGVLIDHLTSQALEHDCENKKLVGSIALFLDSELRELQADIKHFDELPSAIKGEATA